MLEYKHYFPKQNAWNYIHYYRIGLCSRTFVPVTFGPGTAGDRGLLSRVEPPTRTKGSPFVPVGVTNPDKRPLHVIVQKEVILY